MGFNLLRSFFPGYRFAGSWQHILFLAGKRLHIGLIMLVKSGWQHPSWALAHQTDATGCAVLSSARVHRARARVATEPAAAVPAAVAVPAAAAAATVVRAVVVVAAATVVRAVAVAAGVVVGKARWGSRVGLDMT